MSGPIVHIEDTFYIRNASLEAQGQAGLAICPEVHLDSKTIAWQDSTFHPKSTSYTSYHYNPKQGTIRIEREGMESLRLERLTLDVFQQWIHGEVPEKALESDEKLRAWYIELIRNSQ